MKALKLLFLLLAFSAVTFYSCSDSDPVAPIVQPAASQESVALRTAFNEMKTAYDVGGRSAADSVFCFDFVYPITFTFSNGTNVTVSSFAGLLDILANESPQLYLESVVFPFQVAQEGALTTINNETEFVTLLINCGIDTINDDLETTFCFDIIFPITIVENGQNVTINSQEELLAHMNSGTTLETQILFPISVLYGNETVVVNNLYEFYDMIDNCDECICTQEYAPVCVQTSVGIVEFGNLCYAICAGYSQNDLVPCNPTNTCNVSNATVTTGMCSATGYIMILDFDHANTTSTSFEVRTSTGAFFGTFPLASLPLTITNYPFTSANSTDLLTVSISNNPNCSTTAQWIVPCPPPCESVCPANVAPVCVQTTTGLVQFQNECFALCAGFTPNDFVTCGVNPTNFGTALTGNCFDLVYPVQIQTGGQVITANDDGTVLQYWFPSQSPIPAFVYPVTVIRNTPTGPMTILVTGETTFIGSILNNCN